MKICSTITTTIEMKFFEIAYKHMGKFKLMLSIHHVEWVKRIDENEIRVRGREGDEETKFA